MKRQSTHLTYEKVQEEDEDGNLLPAKRVFEKDRSQRLHWINHHIQELSSESIDIFSVMERDQRRRYDVAKTYIYDRKGKYMVILERQRKSSYYSLTTYYLNKKYAEENVKRKMKKHSPDVE